MLSGHSTATIARTGSAWAPRVVRFTAVGVMPTTVPCVIEQQQNVALIDAAAAVQERTG